MRRTQFNVLMDSIKPNTMSHKFLAKNNVKYLKPILQ